MTSGVRISSAQLSPRGLLTWAVCLLALRECLIYAERHISIQAGRFWFSGFGIHYSAPLPQLYHLVLQYRWQVAAIAVCLILLFLGGLRACIIALRQSCKGKLETSRWQKLAVAGIFLFSIFPLGRWLDWGSQGLISGILFDFLPSLIGLMGFFLLLMFFYHWLGESWVRALNSWGQRAVQLPPSLFLLLCGAWVFLVVNLISLLVFHHRPSVIDEVAQLFHAKIFAQGDLYAQPPLLGQFFHLGNIIMSEKWYSQYPPGHSMLLALGILISAPWLINPLLGCLSLVPLYFLARQIYGEQMARLSLTLFAFCPFLLFMSSGFMNHSSALFFLLCFLAFLLGIKGQRGELFAGLSGLCLGLAASVRPFTGLMWSFPFVIYALFQLFQRKMSWKALIIFIIGVGCGLSVLLGYNYLTNGSPFLTGYAVNMEGGSGFGFRSEGPFAHSPRQGLANTSINLTALNDYLFEWFLPSLTLVFLLFFSTRGRQRWDRWLLASVALLIVGHFFYFYQDLTFGPRFFYCAAPLLVMLSARGVLWLKDYLAARGEGHQRAGAALAITLCLCVAYAGSFSLLPLLEKYRLQAMPTNLGNVAAVAEKAGLCKAVVFLPEEIYPSGFILNSPSLKDDVIYARDLGEQNLELRQEFPGRSFYTYRWSSDRKSFILEVILPIF